MSDAIVTKCEHEGCDHIFSITATPIWLVLYSEDWYYSHIVVTCPACKRGSMIFSDTMTSFFLGYSQLTAVTIHLEYADEGVISRYAEQEKLPALRHQPLTRRQKAKYDLFCHELETEDAESIIEELKLSA